MAMEPIPAGVAAAYWRRWLADGDVFPAYVRHAFHVKVFGLLSLHIGAVWIFMKCVAALFPTTLQPAEIDAMLRTRTTAPSPTQPSESWSMLGTITSALLMVFIAICIILVTVMVLLEAFDMIDHIKRQSWFKDHLPYHFVNQAMLLAILILVECRIQDFLGTSLLLESIGVLWVTMALATVCSLMLSFLAGSQNSDLTTQQAGHSHHRLRCTVPVLHQVWLQRMCAKAARALSRGVRFCGVKIAGASLSDLPCVPVLCSWLVVVLLSPCHIGGSSVFVSFSLLWLFLIDADSKLRQSDPDDCKRLVVLMHSKLSTMLLYFLLRTLAGDISWLVIGVEATKYSFVGQINEDVRKFVLNVWPGPPHADLVRLALFRDLQQQWRARLDRLQVIVQGMRDNRQEAAVEVEPALLGHADQQRVVAHV